MRGSWACFHCLSHQATCTLLGTRHTLANDGVWLLAQHLVHCHACGYHVHITEHHWTQFPGLGYGWDQNEEPSAMWSCLCTAPWSESWRILAFGNIGIFSGPLLPEVCFLRKLRKRCGFLSYVLATPFRKSKFLFLEKQGLGRLTKG